MPTSRTQKAAPTQEFEKYIFTKEVSPETSMFPISSRALKLMPLRAYALGGPLTTLGEPGGSGAYMTFSPDLPIGFNFRFNNRTYKTFVASTSGWVVLRDSEDANDFDIADYFGDDYGAVNDEINQQFTTNGVLLCPWADNLGLTYLNVDDVYDSLVSDDQKFALKKGLITPVNVLNNVDGGLRYATTTNKDGSRCLVIRWKARSTLFNNAGGLEWTTHAPIIRFELVLYESGRVEYRYDKRITITTSEESLSDTRFEHATIGVFINDHPIDGWRFRDFADGLNNPAESDSARVRSKYGGYVYSSAFTDTGEGLFGALTTTPYVSTLQAAQSNADSSFPNRRSNWPGIDKSCCIMRFDPPRRRRKILPRVEVRSNDSRKSYPTSARTGDHKRLGTKIIAFDDRRSVTYTSGTVVDYPIGVNRFFGDTAPGVATRQDLFGDFEVTGSVFRSRFDNFISKDVSEYTYEQPDPFVDHGLHEQSQDASFFASGSSLSRFGFSMSQPLKAKTKVEFELPVDFTVKLLETGSAMYYYDSQHRGFFIPYNLRRLGWNDIADPIEAITNEHWPEDARGFNAIGYPISSGTNAAVPTTSWSSDEAFGDASFWNVSRNYDLLTKTYGKSARITSSYRPSESELFSPPINHPFVVEKIVFELPVKLGPGWFNDRTTSTTPTGFYETTPPENLGLNPNVFDFAGPALTVAVHNVIQSPDGSAYYDLIASGSIIPEGDDKREVVVQTTITTTSTSDQYTKHLFVPEGFNCYATAAGIIYPDENGCFTGSAVARLEPGVSSGVILGHRVFATNLISNVGIPNNSYEWSRGVIHLMTSENINTYSNFAGSPYVLSNVQNVVTYGRSGKAVSSGRSLFCTDFISPDYTSVRNPLFVSSSFADFPASIKDAVDISTNPEFQADFRFAVPAIKTQASPYVIYPGDKLAFSLSKTRPTLYTIGTDPVDESVESYWRDGNAHDAYINTGSIRITLYGSVLRENRETHDTLNQSLVSDAIHEALGNEAISDQYEIENEATYYGSYTDDFVTGSMTTTYSFNIPQASLTHSFSYRQSRGKAFSKSHARNQQQVYDVVYSTVNPYYPTVSVNYETATNQRKSSALQPWFEKVGTQKVIRLETYNERLYDTVMPTIEDCLAKDGTPPYVVTDIVDMFDSQYRLDKDKTYGMIMFDMPNSYDGNNVSAELSNNTWNWAYPFEPRYANVRKLLRGNFNSGVTTESAVSNVISAGTLQSISPKKIDHLLIGRIDYNKKNVITSSAFDMMCDVNLTNFRWNNSDKEWKLATGSMSNDDMMRVFYGFGDQNNVSYHEGVRAGHNHQPVFRNVEFVDQFGGTTYSYSFSPTIRGWKYGVANALPLNSTAVYRRGRYGQHRDMLEQRLYTKFYQYESVEGVKSIGQLSPVVTVSFVDSQGNTTRPENTWSQNLSFEVTSSLPYFDGVARNRKAINTSVINQNLITIRTVDDLDNIVI